MVKIVFDLRKCCLQSLVLMLLYQHCSTELPNYVASQLHCPLNTENEKWLTELQVPWGIKNRAMLTIPPEVELRKSHIPNVGLGIFAKTFLPRYTWLGIYEGEVIMDSAEISAYAWTISRGNNVSHYIDGKDLQTSNWLRWINCPRHVSEDNVIPNECQGNQFYMTWKDIRPGEELLIYYGKSYAKHLGIDYKNYYNESTSLKTCIKGMMCCTQ